MIKSSTLLTAFGVFMALCCAATSRAADLVGAGATSPFLLYSKWFDVYKQQTGVDVEYQAIGSGAGIKQFSVEAIDFAASDRPLESDDLKRMRGEFVYLPTVASAVAIVYNLRGVPLKLSPQVLSDIYLGRIQKWNDRRIAVLNPQARLPNGYITIATRRDGSGAGVVFNSYLRATSVEWARAMPAGRVSRWPVEMGGLGGDGVANIVSQTPGAIGYVEWAYAVQNKMPIAAIRNRAGNFIAPSMASTQAAVSAFVPLLQKNVLAPIVDAAGTNSYPICGLTYLLVRTRQKELEKAHQLRRFLRWSMRDGQRFTAPLLYAPLPQALRERNLRVIDAIQ